MLGGKRKKAAEMMMEAPQMARMELSRKTSFGAVRFPV